MTLAQRDSLRHTYAEYLTWTDDERYELIDGIAYVKEPPAPSRPHQELAGELYYQIRSALQGRPFRAYIAPFDVRLLQSAEPDDLVDTVVQPDVLIVRDLNKLDRRGMRGAPDWIAEVLSPGVLEVWFVHPIDRMLTIHRLEGGRYGAPTLLELQGRTAISAIPGVSIDWDRLWPPA